MTGQNYIKKIFSEGKRLDNRKMDEFRKVSVETGILSNAEGSAKIKFGDTELLVGIKMDVLTPFPDTPNEGVLMVESEFVPFASPEFELGPPCEQAVELARVVDRGIRECKAVDVEKLCIEAGEKVWAVHIDINIINHDGNLIDAASIGAIAALLNTKIPKYDAEKGKVIRELGEQLPLKDAPIELTVFKIGDTLFMDPTIEEEDEMEARITMAITQDGNISAIQKGGTGYFTSTEIETAADMIIAKSKDLRSFLK